MRVLILGRSGQLAQALMGSIPAGIEAVAWGREELDLHETSRIRSMIVEFSPDAVINASAYTAVDKAESERENAERLNVIAVGEIAGAARDLGCPFVHVSTDFVFDGSASRPYESDAMCSPLGVYGETKFQGERLILAECPQAAIVRTAWVYRAGSANFMSTMLRLMAERDELGVVADQIGTPTSADNLANVIWRVLQRRLNGVWHYTDAGAASWYDFACAIYRGAKQHQLLTSTVAIKPLRTEDYPTPARRPAYSVLNSAPLRVAVGFPAIHWQDALEEQLTKL